MKKLPLNQISDRLRTAATAKPESHSIKPTVRNYIRSASDFWV